MLIQTLVQDVRYTTKAMRRNASFAAAAVTTLAIGIGATTAVFSIVHGVLLRPLPYPGADRLIRLWEEHPGGVSPAGNRWLSNHTYYAWLGGVRTLDGIGAHATYEYTVTAADERVRLVGAAVTPSIFTLLNVRPHIGRFFNTGEGEEGANRVVVLSDAFWRDHYARDPAVLGRLLVIDEQAHTIVGIARPELRFPDGRVRFWVPNAVPRVTGESTRAFTALGRLRPGATTAQIEAEGTAVARSVVRPVMSTELFFGKGGPVVVHARALREDMTLSVRPALLVLAAAVTLVLLITCANVANLFLSRGIARRRELAIRAAIGGSRARLVSQLLTESAVLAAAGGSLGILVAAALIRFLPVLAPARFPRLDDLQIDSGILAIAGVASLFTAVASGLVPAVRGSRFDLMAAMRGADDAHGRGFRGLRARQLRQAALVLESAFAVILVIGAGLLTRSFVRLLAVDAGYRADHVLTARVHLPRSAPPERMAALLEQVLTRLRATPAVTAAGAGNMMPLLTMTAISTFPVPEVPGGTPVMTRSLTYVVTPGYAEALAMRLRDGRLFTEADARPGPRKMLVNEEFARQYLRGSAVGRQFRDLFPNDKGTITEIVGVVGNVLKDGNDSTPQPEIYFVHGSPARSVQGAAHILVRTIGDPGALAPMLRDVVRETDPAAVVEQATPLEVLQSRAVDEPRFAMIVLVTFAALALALAAVGLYGVLSYNIAQRRRELGIRAAIGAARSDLVGLVLRQGLGVTVAGVAVGIFAAAGLTQFMRGILFGIEPLDATAFVLAPLVVISVATLACVRPALCAASSDPALALRAE